MVELCAKATAKTLAVIVCVTDIVELCTNTVARECCTNAAIVIAEVLDITTVAVCDPCVTTAIVELCAKATLKLIVRLPLIVMADALAITIAAEIAFCAVSAQVLVDAISTVAVWLPCTEIV